MPFITTVEEGRLIKKEWFYEIALARKV